jgi:hypothetical protein
MFLILREDEIRSILERVLRMIFRPETDEVTGNWRKVCNEELRQIGCY